jgi:hypothetical protein
MVAQGIRQPQPGFHERRTPVQKKPLLAYASVLLQSDATCNSNTERGEEPCEERGVAAIQSRGGFNKETHPITN